MASNERRLWFSCNGCHDSGVCLNDAEGGKKGSSQYSYSLNLNVSNLRDTRIDLTDLLERRGSKGLWVDFFFFNHSVYCNLHN